MRAMPASRFIYTLFILALVTVPGCILSPEENVIPPDPTEIYKPLTDRENVIYNLVQTYKYTDIEKYQELLHPDYIWYNQAEDVQSGDVPTDFYSKDDDVAGTVALFQAKVGPNPIVDSIELTIQSGAWIQVTEIGGNPCEDCWETSRPYELTVTQPTKTLYANDLVKFFVVPVMVDGQKLYKIWRADDIQQ